MNHQWLIRVWLVLLAVLQSGVVLQYPPVTLAATTEPSSQPAAMLEDSPQAAVRAYVEALKAADPGAAREVLLPASQRRNEFQQFILDLNMAGPRIARILRTRYAEEARSFAAEHPDALVVEDPASFMQYLDAFLVRLKRANVQIRGASAIVTVPDRNKQWEAFNPLEQTLVLERVGTRWKIDIPQTMEFGKAPQVEADGFYQEARERTRILNEFLAAAEQGRFKTLREFERRYELWNDSTLRSPLDPLPPDDAEENGRDVQRQSEPANGNRPH